VKNITIKQKKGENCQVSAFPNVCKKISREGVYSKMLTVVGFVLILAIAVLLIWGKVSSLPPIFIVLPILAALFCGFNLT
jgi:cytochrome b